MQSITFPFKVGVPKAGEKAIPLTDVEFRYTTRPARLLERACGGNIDRVLARGQVVEAVVLLVCYGLLWNDAEMSEDQAVDLVDEFIDAGGNVTDLTAALYKALQSSGVYGKHEEPVTKKRPRTRAGSAQTAATTH